MKLTEGQEIYLKGVVMEVDSSAMPYRLKFENGDKEWFTEDIEDIAISTISKKEKVSKWFEVETESTNLILVNLDKIIVIGQNVDGEYIVELSEHNNFKITEESYNKLKERLMEE